jgi:hypothetical protein
MKALGDGAAEAEAVVLHSSFATSAQGMRTKVTTYEFEAIDPTTGEPKRYRRSTANTGSSGAARDGSVVTIRYRREDPAISGFPGEKVGGGNLFMLLAGLLFLAIGSAVELIEALTK